MEKVYYTEVTEYERGWGQRPDGYYIATDKKLLEEYIKEHGNSGSPDYYWRCGTIKEALCPSEKIERLKTGIESTTYKKAISVSKLNEYGLVKEL